MQKLSSFISKQVFSLYEGIMAGTIIDICLDKKFNNLTGFIVLSADEEILYFLSKKNIYKISENLVLIKNLGGLNINVCPGKNFVNKEVISLQGEHLGKVCDLFFDEDFYLKGFSTIKNVYLQKNNFLSFGEDIIIVSLDEEKTRISNFYPRNKSVDDATNITVSILEEDKKIYESELKYLGEEKKTVNSVKISLPKKIAQNPNFLLGRTASISIKSDDGNWLIKEGQKITEKTISKAQILNKIYELSSCAN